MGIEKGLYEASLQGQKIDIMSNISDERHKSFVEEFYKLSEKYGCAIQYHPMEGMVIIDTKK